MPSAEEGRRECRRPPLPRSAPPLPGAPRPLPRLGSARRAHRAEPLPLQSPLPLPPSPPRLLPPRARRTSPWRSASAGGRTRCPPPATAAARRHASPAPRAARPASPSPSLAARVPPPRARQRQRHRANQPVGGAAQPRRVTSFAPRCRRGHARAWRACPGAPAAPAAPRALWRRTAPRPVSAHPIRAFQIRFARVNPFLFHHEVPITTKIQHLG